MSKEYLNKGKAIVTKDELVGVLNEEFSKIVTVDVNHDGLLNIWGVLVKMSVSANTEEDSIVVFEIVEGKGKGLKDTYLVDNDIGEDLLELDDFSLGVEFWVDKVIKEGGYRRVYIDFIESSRAVKG